MEQENRLYRFKISLFNEKVQIRITLLTCAGRRPAYMLVVLKVEPRLPNRFEQERELIDVLHGNCHKYKIAINQPNMD